MVLETMNEKGIGPDRRSEFDRIAPSGYSTDSPCEAVGSVGGGQAPALTKHLEVHPIIEGSNDTPRFARSPLRSPEPGRSDEVASRFPGPNRDGHDAEPSQATRSFAYGVAHDLKEPLRVIKGHLEFLERKAGNHIGDEETAHLDQAQKSTQDAVELVQTLVDHARAGGKENPRESVDANLVVEEAVSNLQALVREQNAQIRTDDLPEVVGDPQQLCRVFQNLVHNALKYQGGRPPRIHIAHERTAEGHRFSVIDNGLGLSSTARQDLFEMFSNASRENEDGGTGMGLALCREIVENHGGRIWVESEPGEGSTFHFTVAKSPVESRAPP